MSKFLKTAIIGAVSGAAAAYFLSTDKGKQFKKKIHQTFTDYKENPKEYHQYAADKVNEYKDVAVHSFKDYKDKFETGELTKDNIISSVKEKASQAGEFANSKLSQEIGRAHV